MNTNLIFLFLLAGTMLSCNPSTSKKDEISLPKHVILVGFDGLSASSIRKGADMPMLRQLMAEGSSSLECRSILPSSSACNWASMFMGAGPELHGYTTWGSQTPDLPSRVTNSDNRFPNIFGLYREKNPTAEIGYIFEWGGMHYLVDTLAMNYHRQVANCTQSAVTYIKEKKPNLCAVIYDEPDGVGHNLGWDTSEYMEKIHQLDKYLAEIVNAVKEAGMMDDAVIIVTSDHGGIGTGHGGKTMEEMQRPLVYYGKNIKKGFQIPESTMIYDIAGTIAYLLAIDQPQVWIARPTLSVFESNK